MVLRPYKKADYEVWFDAYVNRLEPLNKWDEGPVPKRKCSKRHFENFLKKLKELGRKDDYYRYGVFKKKTGELIGHVDFDIFVRGTHQFSNFGYQIYNQHWGNGYGREAARKGLFIGFRQLKLNRLEAAINFENRKSIRLAKLIGMQKEGIKKRYWFEFGEWTDHVIYVANPEDVGLNPSRPF